MAAGDITASRTRFSDFPCAVFDGVDDQIDFTVSDVVNFNALTISMWINIKPTGSNSDILDAGYFTDPFGVVFEANLSNSTVNAFIKNTAGTFASKAFAASDKTWHHVGVVWDGINMAGIIDGTLTATAAIGGTVTANAYAWRLGRKSSGTNPIDGAVRDIRVYDRALSSTEINSLYNGTSITQGLIHNWKLKDDYNDSARSAHGTATGPILNNTIPNKLLTDSNFLNLAAATDKIIAIPKSGRDGKFTVIGANRATA